MSPSTTEDGPSDQAPGAQLSVQNGSGELQHTINDQIVMTIILVDMSSLSPLELHQLTQVCVPIVR